MGDMHKITCQKCGKKQPLDRIFLLETDDEDGDEIHEWLCDGEGGDCYKKRREELNHW